MLRRVGIVAVGMSLLAGGWLALFALPDLSATGRDSLSSHPFLFRGRGGDRLKVLLGVSRDHLRQPPPRAVRMAGMRHQRLSVVLPVAALAAVLFFWVTSYYRYRVFSKQGRVLVLVVKAAPDGDRWLRESPPTAATWGYLRTDKAVRFGGVEFVPFTADDRYEYTYYNGPTKGSASVSLCYWLLAVPYWLPALAAAAWALARVAAAVRLRRRRNRGQCVACGYDLRATTSGRCPECGILITAKTA